MKQHYGMSTNGLLFIPGGLFELILPLWLIFRGFNQSALQTA